MVIISLLAALIGMAVGAVAGYFRGWIDQVLMRFTDLFITFPVIVIGAVLGKLAGGGGAVLARPWRSGCHHLDDAGAAGARRVPDPARAGVRRRRQGRRRQQLPDHPQAHDPQRDGRDHREHHAAGVARRCCSRRR